MWTAIKKSQSYKAFSTPIITANPISTAVLGICSALAVTTQVNSAIVMTLSLTVVLAGSNMIISMMRNHIPKSIRIIVELTVIATLVILADQVLKAFLFDVSKQLSVFVGLIITNCIVMGRAEAFALANPPGLSFWDGLGNGLGYGYILVVVAFIRELFGAGTLFGLQVVPPSFYEMGYQNMGIMVLAPGAFIVIGVMVWIQNLVIERRS
jgi:Na+-transporting NADH:ubiquinone oxidoreductase subunit D